MKSKKISLKKTIKKKIEHRQAKIKKVNRKAKSGSVSNQGKVVSTELNPHATEPIKVSFPVRMGKPIATRTDKIARKVEPLINRIDYQINNQLSSFTIVIPTMWMSDMIMKMLPIYENSKYVKSVIIIDNNVTKRPDLSRYRKVKYYANKQNIYVNPAWNMGFSKTNNNIILANDDIIITRLDGVLKLISMSNYDILGMDVGKIKGGLGITTVDTFPENSYGCFMYIRNYHYIPDQLKIWYGDTILFKLNKKRGLLKNTGIFAEKSKTINSDVNRYRNVIGRNDIIEYEKLMKTNNKMNIIIRTSGRPKYFENCVKSIKDNGIDAKLHVTIDDIKDLEYVRKYANGLDYSYYLNDKEVVGNICKNINVERELFTYNYYFNIVKPFLNGWCLFLDDDDALVTNPTRKMSLDSIYLYKVQVGDRIVPSKSNFNVRPVLNDISGLSIVFHSSQMIDWKPQRGGDFGFIDEMFSKYKTVWVDKILSKTQTGGNLGKRNDLNTKMVTVNLATFPQRKKHMITTINALLKIDLIDKIRVYLNEYGAVPSDFPKSDKIFYYVGKHDRKDSGKFYWAGTKKNEYYFTIDDDLVYDESYFVKHIELLKKYKNEIFVTSHGKVMKQHPTSFMDFQSSYHCLRDVSDNVWINNGGTGVMVFDNSIHQISNDLFEYHGMTDLWIAYYAQKNKIPIICRKHNKNDLNYLLGNEETLFDVRHTMINNHNKILNRVNGWVLYKKINYV
jgi:hypothetical protein